MAAESILSSRVGGNFNLKYLETSLYLCKLHLKIVELGNTVVLFKVKGI